MASRWSQSCLLLALLCSVLAFNALAAEPTWPAGWTNPYPAHRVIGPLFNVGFEDLSVFLIETKEGHILINTGLEDSLDAIQKNV